MLFHSIFASFIISYVSDTVESTLLNTYLATRPTHIIGDSTWLYCITSCHREPKCVSYNYHALANTCELFSYGTRSPVGCEKDLRTREGSFFQQLKCSSNYCDCSCCATTGCRDTSYDLPAISGSIQPTPVSLYLFPTVTTTQTPSIPQGWTSCHAIFARNGTTTNGQYTLTLAGKPYPVFCKMVGPKGCRSNGWTLVMKIDGRKSTFRYQSNFWSSKDSYQPENGVNMDHTETMLPTYWSVPFDKLCVGMFSGKDGLLRFISISYNSSSLYDVIAGGKYQPINKKFDKWKKLIGREASIQIGCIEQGFNVHSVPYPNSSRARIGMVGYSSSCQTSSSSRLGFGTQGKVDGKDPDKAVSCGNAAGNNSDEGDVETNAFGFIFVR